MKNIIKLAILIVSASVFLSGCFYFKDPEIERRIQEHNARLDEITAQYLSDRANSPYYK